MSFFQVVGWILLAVAVYYAQRHVRAAWQARRRAAGALRAEQQWPPTTPPDAAGDANAGAKPEFSDDTAPAVLSMPFGLEDPDGVSPKRDTGRRRQR
jgi:hypothetical protein